MEALRTFFHYLSLLLVLAPYAYATEYVLDKSESRLEFSAEQQGAAFRGRFETFSAQLVIDPQQADNNFLEAEIDLVSVNTDYPERDDYLVGEEWFNVAKWPVAKFTANSFTINDDDSFSADGFLNLRGKEQAVSMQCDFDGRRLTGKTSIDRRDFGVGQGMWADDRMVGAKVLIEVNVLFKARD